MESEEMMDKVPAVESIDEKMARMRAGFKRVGMDQVDGVSLVTGKASGRKSEKGKKKKRSDLQVVVRLEPMEIGVGEVLEMGELTKEERLFVQMLPVVNWNTGLAFLRVYPKRDDYVAGGAAYASQRRVKIAVESVKRFMVKKFMVEVGDDVEWSFDRSIREGLRILQECYQHIWLTASPELSRDGMRVWMSQKRRWVEIALVAKEKLDRLHGYMKESNEYLLRQQTELKMPKELAGLTSEELRALGLKIDEKLLTQKQMPVEVMRGGGD